jgi:hypothetical protein
MGICRCVGLELRRFEQLVLIMLIVGGSIGLQQKVAHSAEIALTWEANTEPNLTGYRVYYGTASETYYYSVDIGNVTSCSVSNLLVGQTYYFVVTAYNTDGIESEYSEEVSVAVEAPIAGTDSDCLSKGVACSTDDQCCSGKCRGRKCR